MKFLLIILLLFSLQIFSKEDCSSKFKDIVTISQQTGWGEGTIGGEKKLKETLKEFEGIFKAAGDSSIIKSITKELDGNISRASKMNSMMKKQLLDWKKEFQKNCIK